MWGAYNGRLYFTFRGASAEITDMAVSEDNRLLAAGSTDRIIRVWCLATAAPVAVLGSYTCPVLTLRRRKSSVSDPSPSVRIRRGLFFSSLDPNRDKIRIQIHEKRPKAKIVSI